MRPRRFYTGAGVVVLIAGAVGLLFSAKAPQREARAPEARRDATAPAAPRGPSALAPAPRDVLPAPVATTTPSPAEEPVARASAPAPQRGGQPSSPPKVVGTDEPEGDAAVRAQWERRLEREDEILVEQAVAAGATKERAALVRRALAERRAARARTLADLRTGKITRAEMVSRARATKQRTDAALRAALSDHELAALDPDGARAQVAEGD